MIKKWLLACFTVVCAGTNLQAQQEDQTLKLWYDKPATQWVEALRVISFLDSNKSKTLLSISYSL